MKTSPLTMARVRIRAQRWEKGLRKYAAVVLKDEEGETQNPRVRLSSVARDYRIFRGTRTLKAKRAVGWFLRFDRRNDSFTLLLREAPHAAFLDKTNQKPRSWGRESKGKRSLWGIKFALYTNFCA